MVVLTASTAKCDKDPQATSLRGWVSLRVFGVSGFSSGRDGRQAERGGETRAPALT
jgi:hypothetical protein